MIVKIIYTINKKLLKNPLVQLKEKNTPIDYFCVVYPSGRVEQWPINRAIYKRTSNLGLDSKEERLCLYVANQERVTVELMAHALNDESNYFQKKIILCRLNNRKLQLKERRKTIGKGSNRMYNDFTILHNAFADG